MTDPYVAATSSLWTQRDHPTYAPLVGDLETDVVVVGAGLAGLTTAALLARAGREVTVLEARSVGEGTSGRTTAKATALQGLRYRTIARHHGAEGARRYATAQVDALAWMDHQVRTSGIECAWERRPAVSYATTDEGLAEIQDEVAAATAAGLPVTFRRELELPYPITGAVELDDQVQFDPGPYLDALAAEVHGHPGGRVHEGSRVTAVRGRRRYEVVTEGGIVTADHVVVATLLPIVDRGLFFARAEPKSSYLVALRVGGPLPEGMYLSVDSPTRSLRTARDDEGELLLVGGEGHHTGERSPTSEAYRALEDWATERFPVQDVVSRWSAHDYVPADHLPWVGPSSPLTPGVLVATGFEKWGMTMGTAAAIALADSITGATEGPSAPWASLFDPGRHSGRGLLTAAKLNAQVAGRLASGWARPEAPPAPDGSGRRYRSGLVPAGEAEPGEGPAVSTVCTHLGGVCAWNDGDRTWDCPLHGSRFEGDGTVVAGPATTPLRTRRR